MNAEGITKSALLLMSIGEEEAAQVFKFLGPREVQKIGVAMAALRNVTREQVDDVLQEFAREAEQHTALSLDSSDYIRSVLNKALGEDKAGAIIDRILQGSDTSGIEGLKWMDSAAVAELIKNEHPQIIATILVHLDRDQASEISACFAERLRNDVLLRIATLDGIQPAALREVDDVLQEFAREAEQHTALSLDSSDYIRSVLNKALGEDKAGAIIDRILQGSDTSGIEGLKWMDSAAVAELIKNEHPQIIATILVHLDRDQASEISACFAERLRNDVLLRIATLDGIQPAALRELDDVLTGLLSGSDNLKRSPMGGIRTAAEILNFMPSNHEESVLENVRQYDAELAQKIVDQMFVFENLLDLEDRAIQLLLKEVESEALIISLKGAQPALRQKFLSNMSQRAAELLAEDLDARGPVRVSEVETQQRRILQIVRNLAESGQIVIGGKAEDAYV